MSVAAFKKRGYENELELSRQLAKLKQENKKLTTQVAIYKEDAKLAREVVREYANELSNLKAEHKMLLSKLEVLLDQKHLPKKDLVPFINGLMSEHK